MVKQTLCNLTVWHNMNNKLDYHIWLCKFQLPSNPFSMCKYFVCHVSTSAARVVALKQVYLQKCEMKPDTRRYDQLSPPCWRVWTWRGRPPRTPAGWPRRRRRGSPSPGTAQPPSPARSDNILYCGDWGFNDYSWIRGYAKIFVSVSRFHIYFYYV